MTTEVDQPGKKGTKKDSEATMKKSPDKPPQKDSTKQPSSKLKEMLRDNLLMKETLNIAKEVQGRPQTPPGMSLKKKDLH